MSLLCEAMAIPTPSITWLKNEEILDLSASSIDISFSNRDNSNTSTLVLSSLNFTDTARYSCFAVNSLASVQNSTSLAGILTVNCKY